MTLFSILAKKCWLNIYKNPITVNVSSLCGWNCELYDGQKLINCSANNAHYNLEVALSCISQ